MKIFGNLTPSAWRSAWAFTAALGLQPAAHAQTADDNHIEEITVLSTRNQGIVPARNSDSAFGLSQSLVDTPRAISVVQADTLQSYGIQSINDFINLVPGTFTGSFYGVPGALQLRGQLADNYFRGFRRVENDGSYATPIDASSEIEIIRGPTPTVYGAGKVGGFLNFIPKTAKTDTTKYIDTMTGAASLTVGSYDEHVGTAEVGIPLTIGGNKAGIYAFTQIQDSGSFYDGIHPKSQLGQIAFSSNLGDHWQVEAGGQYDNNSGDLQTPGWNRVTQTLINTGSYLSGKPLTPIVQPGQSFITPADINRTGGVEQFVLPAYGYNGYTSPTTMLNPATVKTVQLSPHDVFVSNLDLNKAQTRTAYFDLGYEISETQALKLQFFYDDMNVRRYVSYGYAAEFSASVAEGRLTYTSKFAPADWINFDNVVGVGTRTYDDVDKQNFAAGYVVLDRRDLSVGATPDDIVNFPFASPGEPVWDQNFHSTTRDTGLFANTNVTLFDRLKVLLGARWDFYNVSSVNIGTTTFNVPLGQRFSGSDSPVSYNGSISYDTGLGIVPYATYSNARALETLQSGGIDPSNIANHDFASPSDLVEVGVKGMLLSNTLYFALDAYRQDRTQRDETGSIQGIRSKGVEGELRYKISDNWSLTASATVQNTRIKSPGNGVIGVTVVLPPSALGYAPQNGYGGLYITSAGFVPGLQNGYTINAIPNHVVSLFATHTWDDGFGLTGGMTYVSQTGGNIPGAVVFPDYALFRASAYYALGNYRIDLAVNNIFDKRYFIPVQDVYDEVGALPGIGRTVEAKFTYKF